MPAVNDNVEVNEFFKSMDETERKNVKELSCKLVKQIGARVSAEQRLDLVKRENEALQDKVEELETKIAEMGKEH